MKQKQKKIRKKYTSPSINRIKIKMVTLGGSDPKKKENKNKYPAPF